MYRFGIKVGDTVTWESQLGGSRTKKEGTVIADLPPVENAWRYIPEGTKKSHIKFDKSGLSSKHRALVAVPSGKTGQITHYYCPHVWALKVIGKEV